MSTAQVRDYFRAIRAAGVDTPIRALLSFVILSLPAAGGRSEGSRLEAVPDVTAT